MANEPTSDLVESRRLAAELSWWQPVLLGAFAGGMGWGIRGQYGHETGAMIAGLLLCLGFAHMFRPHASTQGVARAVAWGTVAIGFGGSMTYGQTIGLTHDAPLVGNWAALGWGMLGLAIKGGIWFGFAGVFLGMGLGGRPYRPLELYGLLAGMLGLFWLGSALLNGPFDPAHKVLPPIYFSEDWRWEPDADLKPRREVWGGLLFALVGLIVYVSGRKRDVLARNLGLGAVLAGAIGFPLGQSLQAYHAWHREWFASGAWAAVDPIINWWNLMEFTFGATAGAGLGLGLWVNRKHLSDPGRVETGALSSWLAWGLLVVHTVLLVGVEFGRWPAMDALYDLGLVAGIIPVVAVAGNRWWPYAVVFPITALPIAGKTLRALVYEQPTMGPVVGWAIYLLAPLALTLGAAVWWSREDRQLEPSHRFTRFGLILATWLYFGLNFAFFRFPWPWEPWTQRTPSALVFLICALGLTQAARWCPRPGPKAEEGGGRQYAG